MFKIGVFAIIVDNNNHVLLSHRRDYDLWNLPGGRLEVGEVPWDGVVREVKEETGLDVEVVKLAGVYSKRAKQEIVFTFHCRITGGEIQKSDEADQHRYFNSDDLPKNTIPKQVERIHDALDAKGEVQLKIQEGPSSLDLMNQGKL